MSVGRFLIYWARKCSVLHWLDWLFGELTDAVVSRTFGDRYYSGIQLIAYRPHGLAQLAAVFEALDLIRRTDKRRFLRVERHIKRIILANWSKRIIGRYIPFGKVCHLRKLPETERSRRFQVWYYAVTIVHEATHGFLDSKRFPITKTNKAQIERICYNEEYRFAAKIPGMGERLEAFGNYERLCKLESGIPERAAIAPGST